MTVKTFWSDPYLCRHRSRVAAVEGNRVTLESTIFFAFSGGQESDAGSIGGFPVLKAETAGRDLVYTLPEGHGLEPGEEVDIAVDWARRYRLMRLHFAAELVLELVQRALPAVAKIGAHIAPDKARIDFALAENISARLPGIAEAANAMVRSDLPVSTAFEDAAAERRYWEIAGFCRVPCGGTHIRRTGEVGSIRLRRQNIGRGKERVEILLDEPAPGASGSR